MPERLTTPESVYLSRRQLLLAAGFLGIESALPTSATGPSPATRNPEFKLDRQLTPEWAATSYNNFYEFSSDKAQVKNKTGDFVTTPWSIEIKGLVNKPGTYDLDDPVRSVDLAVILYLGVFQIGLAYVFLTAAVRQVQAVETSLLLLLEPVLNPVWAAILHGERPGMPAVLGGTLVVLATLGSLVLGRTGQAPRNSAG